jgi:hypothetical protein
MLQGLHVAVPVAMLLIFMGDDRIEAILKA